MSMQFFVARGGVAVVQPTRQRDEPRRREVEWAFANSDGTHALIEAFGSGLRLDHDDAGL